MKKRVGTKPKGEQISFVCAPCGKHFELPVCVAKGRPNPTCSRECRHELQRGRKAQQKLPAGSFQLRDDAETIEHKVKEHIDAGLNGPQIDAALGLTRGVRQNILLRNGWNIAPNTGRSLENGNCKKVASITRACGFCGKENQYKPWQLKDKKHKFCNLECSTAYFASRTGAQADAYKERVRVVCKGCQDVFEKAPGDIKRDAGLFCTRPCYEEWQTQQTGPLSPLWKGGTKKTRGPGWARQKAAAAKRDKHTCQLCGEFKGTAIHIHHIRPFYLFDKPVEANVLSNLVALCASCHKSVEGHTDEADITNWREAYERNRDRVLGETQKAADEVGENIRQDYRENGLTRMQCLEKYNIKDAVFYLAVYGKRDRRNI